jgi:hypothetical protein
MSPSENKYQDRPPMTKKAIRGEIRINWRAYAGESALKYQVQLFIFTVATYI